MIRAVVGQLLLGAAALQLATPCVASADTGLPTLFVPRVYYVGDEPRDLASADLNHDGRPDLITAHYNAPYFSVLLGTASGVFAPEIRIPTSLDSIGLYHYRIATGDLDNDGFVDVVLRQHYGLSVFLGNGDGTFGPRSHITTGSDSGEGPVALADIDADGNLDVITGPSPISIHRGAGDGSFLPYETIPGSFGGSLLVDQFTDDSVLDIIGGSQLWVGEGDGTFPTVVPLDIQGGSRNIAYDLNGDGWLDIINSYLGIQVYLATGPGGFGDVTVYPPAVFTPGRLALADLNRDGHPDVVGAKVNFESLEVLFSNGDGTFAPAINHPMPLESAWVVGGDFDGDGHDEIASCSFRPGIGKSVEPGLVGAVTVLESDSDGVPIDERFEFFAVGENPLDSAVSDFDGDGQADLATANNRSDDVSVLLAGTGGSLLPEVRFPAGSSPVAIAAGDFDGDGASDLAVANAGSLDIVVLPGVGNGSFSGAGPPLPLGSVPSAMARGDFNADTIDDLAVASFTSENGDVTIFLGHPGGLQPLAALPISDEPKHLTVVDLDSQNGSDLVIALSATDEVVVFLSRGDGTFDSPSRFAHGRASVDGMDGGDLNGDGHPDVALVGLGAASVTVLHGDGYGALGTPAEFPAGARSQAAKIVDFDGDAIQDVFTADRRGSIGSVLFGTSTGLRFHQSLVWDSCGTTGGTPAIGDFDGDGLLDLVATNCSHDRASVVLNRFPVLIRFPTDKALIRWPRLVNTLSYNIYRGDLSDLHDGDADGLPDDGHGACRNDFDPDLTDPIFVDEEQPAPGDGFFYLMARVTAHGETGLGTTTTGQPRVPAVPCP